jgi:hypothetical protein
MFDRDIAVQLGFACQYAYEASAFLKNRLKLGGGPASFSYCDDNKPPTSFASLLRYPQMRVLAFQGTITRKFPDIGKYDFDAAVDWLENFQIELIGSDKLSFHVPGRIHKGFASQLDLIYSKVTAELGKDAATPIYVTGHSQGGAIAAIATKALVNDGFPVRAAYTFAAPRPGNVDFTRSVTTEVHRIEYGDDVVPHVPMRTSLPKLFELALRKAGTAGKAGQLLQQLLAKADPSYEPVGALTYASDDLGVQFDMADQEAADLANHRRTHLLFAGKNLVEHHHMFNYLHGVLGVPMPDAKNLEAAPVDAVAMAAGGPPIT